MSAWAGFPPVEWVRPESSQIKTLTAPTQAWGHAPLPNKKNTAYTYAVSEGRAALKASAVSSASMLRQPLRVGAAELGVLRFAWKVPALIARADLSQRELHDTPARVMLVFEGDRSKFSAKNAMLSELAHALTGEPLPYATLSYVWCNDCKPYATITNPRTDRIREIPLESGPASLGRWVDYERDIVKDFTSAFGEAPGALLAVGIMTDTDNTGGSAEAWYGRVSVVSPAQVQRPALKVPVKLAE